jgi:glycine cleavage system regulatory protein
MTTSLVLTIIGEDRPGLVEQLSQTLATHHGSWLESRMANLAGKFAGIVHAEVPDANSDALTQALKALASEGLRIIVEKSGREPPAEDYRLLKLELVGHDRVGIVRDISEALASKRVNIDELTTQTTSASMSGETHFEAAAKLRVPETVTTEELREALESLANELMVDISLDDQADT